MTEITQADRDAAARAWAEDNDEPLDCHICEQIRAGYGDNSLDVIRFARHRKYGYDQGYYDGRQFDRMEERAAIVAWLRGSGDPVIANWISDQIEEGKHNNEKL